MDADGTYVLRLSATDTAGNAASDEVTVIWDTAAPVVEAGNSSSHNNVFNLDGSASDGLSGIASIVWSTTSGSGNVTFDDTSSPTSACSMDIDGTYVLRLTATDNLGHTATDTVTVVWDTTDPVVDTGGSLSKNTAFNLTGTASDGLSGLESITWSMLSGPGTVTFGNTSSLTSSCSMDTDGT